MKEDLLLKSKKIVLTETEVLFDLSYGLAENT
jgi:hypothetical protein